ncbi:MAG: hydroxymethylpyrimidine/phosphomethylpyrimidine kinase [Flavobacteriales bacterium]|jgi:hydroxymethylpyrimidine/phosphomethylpyrimidine kinase|nr:hydroxymethylpyrimidine/phosphomethylpyrimidine kinase [Flavobacteriales bacterium]
MAGIRKKIVSIAGFDPSGGAGILADIKTFEQFKCLGFAIQTAFTIQNEDRIEEVFWHALTKIEAQFKILAEKHQIDAIKIGITKNAEQLNHILDFCENYFPNVPIVWDPVLKSSSEHLFWDQSEINKIDWNKIHWMTPNWDEAQLLFGEFSEKELIENIQQKIDKQKVVLKGGHHPTALGKDFLIEKKGIYPFNPKKGNATQKHGSGCIFSSSLASALAMGYPKIKAVLKAKSYTFDCLVSNETQLAYHKKG